LLLKWLLAFLKLLPWTLKLIESKGWKIMVHSYMCNELSGWKQRKVLILNGTFVDSNGTGPILWWRGVRSADSENKDKERQNSGFQPTSKH